MALPTIETPRYELTLPSQDIKVQFRPFLVKEEKILLVAMESKDNNEIISATKDILKACTFDKLLAKMDPRTGAVTEENPDFLKKGDAAMVLIKPTKPLAIEEQGKFKPLARFAIRDMGATVAAGMCLKIEEHWD